MKIITLATVFLCILCACNKNTISYERAYDMDTSHTIPIDNALKELDAFLAADLTKGSNFKISDTLTIYSSHKTVTKGSSPEELLYVVNFEENAGSAILAADDRISAKVIAVTESGQFALKDFKKIENANRTFLDFSLNGPGMYPNPLDTTDIIINPNTFELYNPEVDDYYIGNLLVSDNTPATINKCDDTEENKQLLSVLIIDYAEGEIGKTHPKRPLTHSKDTSLMKDTKNAFHTKQQNE